MRDHLSERSGAACANDFGRGGQVDQHISSEAVPQTDEDWSSNPQMGQMDAD
jgi:hypothetical protein